MKQIPAKSGKKTNFGSNLSWRIDPDGSLELSKHFNSPYRENAKITIDEYYRYIFENTKGLNEKAALKKIWTALEYMRKYGAFEVEDQTYNVHLEPLTDDELKDTEVDSRRLIEIVKRAGKTCRRNG